MTLNGVLGSSTVSYNQGSTGAATITQQAKNQQVVSVLDFGADPTGATSNDIAMANSLSTASVVVVPANGTSYAGSAVTVPSTKVLRGENNNGAAVSASITLSSNSRIEKLNLINTSSPISPLIAATSNVKLDGLTIATAGYAVNLTNNTYPGFGIDVSNCVINSTGYALLTGANGGNSPLGSGQVRMVNNTASTVNADAIEQNYPFGRPKGFVTMGNFLSQSGAASGTAGFGIGAAAVEQAVYVGNVVTDASAECFHLEDSYKNVSIVANSFYGRSHGVNVIPVMQTGETALPATIMGNTAATSTTASGFGYYLFYTTPATVSGHTLIGNVASNYLGGYHIGAGDIGNHAVNYLGGNVADNCVSAMYGIGNVNGYWTVQRGENIAKNCQYLFSVNNGNCFFGKVTSTTTPSGIAAPFSYGAKMPSRIDGFSYPEQSTSTYAGLVNMLSFAAGGMFFGRFRYAGKSTGTNNWANYSATLKYDGTTLTVTDVVSRCSGGLITNVTVVLSAGRIFVQATCSGGFVMNGQWVDFDGEYWDA